MEYIIRPAVESDWPEIKQIYEAGMDSGLATFEAKAPSYELWSDSETSNCRLVIESATQILGFCKLSLVSKRPV